MKRSLSRLLVVLMLALSMSFSLQAQSLDEAARQAARHGLFFLPSSVSMLCTQLPRFRQRLLDTTMTSVFNVPRPPRATFSFSAFSSWFALWSDAGQTNPQSGCQTNPQSGYIPMVRSASHDLHLGARPIQPDVHVPPALQRVCPISIPIRPTQSQPGTL